MDMDDVLEELRSQVEFPVLALSEEDRSFLAELEMPESVVQFYKASAPAEQVSINCVNLLPIEHIRDECESTMNGIGLFEAGFMPIASTVSGGLYFVGEHQGDHFVGMADLDEVDEDTSREEIVAATLEHAMPSLSVFLQRFASGELAD